MINFLASAAENLPQIVEWTSADPYHKHQGQPEWWLTGNGLLAFCVYDAQGPLTYVRLDEEGEYIRVHTQFAPESVVSKHRLVVGMLEGFAKLIERYKNEGKKGMIFNSVSPTLIAFMGKKFKFQPVGSDDYRLDFEGQQ